MDRILGIKGSWGFSQLTNTVETIAAPENAVLQVNHLFMYFIWLWYQRKLLQFFDEKRKKQAVHKLWSMKIYFQFTDISLWWRFSICFSVYFSDFFSEFLGCFHWGSREYIWLSLHRWENCCGNQKMVEPVSQWACVIVSPAVITDILHIQGHPYISPWQPSYCKDY